MNKWKLTEMYGNECLEFGAEVKIMRSAEWNDSNGYLNIIHATPIYKYFCSFVREKTAHLKNAIK